MFHKECHKIIIVSFLFSAIFTILIENFITTYNIKITRKGTNIECWICDQVVASYRIYEEQENIKVIRPR